MISLFHFHFWTFVTWLRENYDYRNVSWEIMICIYDLTFDDSNALDDGSYLMQCAKLFAYVNNIQDDIKCILQDKQFHLQTWKCADPELEQQFHCFPYGECSDVPRFQQVEQKAFVFYNRYIRSRKCSIVVKIFKCSDWIEHDVFRDYLTCFAVNPVQSCV
jgi:hypothetical protein